MSHELAVGDPAPELDLPTADGGRVTFGGGRSERVIVYFFPAAGTPGCTLEARDFEQTFQSRPFAGFRILGVSPDPPERLAAFAKEHDLTFDLASDPGMATIRRWGAIGPKVKDGRTTEGVRRSTVVIDGAGRVEWAAYGVTADGHVADLAQRLGLEEG